jgi:hemerythrin superfamily protein
MIYKSAINQKSRLFILTLTLLIGLKTLSYSQQLGMTFQEAENAGIRISYLDSTFKSAVHVDTSQAVFKTDAEQELMINAYIKLLQDFGKHLNQNKFYWDKPTRCFNRIYFNPDGTIEYFLFNFIGKTAGERPTIEQQEVFKKLLNDFIKDYKINMKANTKYAQCSPTTYMP